VNTDQSRDIQSRILKITTLVEELQHCPDQQTRRQAEEVVAGLMELHGAALQRIMDQVAAMGEMGPAVIESLARDELVSGLLLLYGLHPHDLETRVRRGLAKARPLLKSHGGDVELLDVRDGLVRLRLEGSCHGCPSSALTLKNAIEEAIYETAPDVISIEVEGETELALGTQATFVPLTTLSTTGWRGAAEPRDLPTDSARRFASGEPSIPTVAGEVT
jgi:Fe-S cluster biogenesis protein NfuA